MTNRFQGRCEFRRGFRTGRSKHLKNLDLQHREETINLIRTHVFKINTLW